MGKISKQEMEHHYGSSYTKSLRDLVPPEKRLKLRWYQHVNRFGIEETAEIWGSIFIVCLVISALVSAEYESWWPTGIYCCFWVLGIVLATKFPEGESDA